MKADQRLLRNVRGKCAHNANGHGIGCQDVHTHIYNSDKHTSAREEIKISPPNLSEGGSLRSLIIMKKPSGFRWSGNFDFKSLDGTTNEVIDFKYNVQG